VKLVFQAQFNVLNEHALSCFPDFLQLLLLSRLSATPLSLRLSSGTLLLLLEPPTLSLFKTAFRENQGPFPDRGFFDFLQSTNCALIYFQTDFDPPSRIDHRVSVMDGDLLQAPALFRIAVDGYGRDHDFVAAVVNEFVCQTLSAPDLQTVLQVICDQETEFDGAVPVLRGENERSNY
jgi:hypothetical protein